MFPFRAELDQSKSPVFESAFVVGSQSQVSCMLLRTARLGAVGVSRYRAFASQEFARAKTASLDALF